MKKFISMLSLVAIMASTLCVSCIEPKEHDLIPAFPAKKEATYAPGTNGYAWTIASEHKFTSGNNWIGFEVMPEDKSKTLLNYYVEPNMSWSAKIVGDAAEYLQFRVLKSYDLPEYDEESYKYTSTVSGKRGPQKVVLKPIKTPAFGEEAKVCELEITMNNETMPLATITIEPALQ